MLHRACVCVCVCVNRLSQKDVIMLETISSSSRSCAYKEYIVLFSEGCQMTKEGKIHNMV